MVHHFDHRLDFFWLFPSFPPVPSTHKMLIKRILLAAAGAAGVVALPHAAGPSDLASNHVYRSPSTTVDALGVDVGTIYNTQDRRRWADTYQGNITYPYGVASVRSA